LNAEISTQILPINLRESPMTKSNIETSARKMRYQALGKACKALSTTNLLIGHHFDDQAETVLMRLVCGHTSMLSGIEKVAKIPECYGLHGIFRSGSLLALAPSKLPVCSGVVGIEKGGVHLVRPLLDFSKSRLIATCQHHGMPWFEDETNRDKTLTTRNAIRHILEKHYLPEALSRGALVQLSKSKKQEAEKISRQVEDLFNQMPFTLDLRSSLVTVQFPELDFTSITKTLSPGSSSFDLAHRVAQMLIRRVIQLVAPHQTVAPGPLSRAVEPVFHNGAVSVFEVSGVQFERLGNSKHGNSSMEWRVLRTPPTRGQKISKGGLQSSPVSQRIPPISNRAQKFEFWDTRFWIHVHNPFKHDLWIRPLDSDNITLLRSLLAEGKVVLRSTRSDRNITRGDKYLDIILRKAAPGKSRWSLPVILSYAPTTSERTTTRKGQLSTPQILAFPTLGLRVEAQEEGLWPPGVEELDWEVRYKQIDLGTKQLEECLVGYGQKT
jgi:tRNA(Ile)-lysidine synthase